MTAKDIGVTALIAGMVGLTVAHLGARISWAEAAKPPGVSELEVGDELPAVFVRDLEDGDDQSALVPLARRRCQLIVAFSPTCPYCKAAAVAEALLPDGGAIPTTWVMLHDNPSLGNDFLESVREESIVVYSEAAGDSLRVSAVPAAFLVGPDDVLKDVFPYQGDEPRAALLDRC